MTDLTELRLQPHNLYARLRPGTSGTGVIFLHGWASSTASAEHYALGLQEQGIASLTFDMRGHGETGGGRGRLGESEYLEDCLTAYDFFAQHVHTMYVNGSSFGAYMTALVLSERSPDGAILRVPALYPDNADTAMKAVADFTGKLMIVESARDEVIPARVPRMYAKAAPTAVYEIMDAPHTISNSPALQQEYLELLESFIAA